MFSASALRKRTTSNIMLNEEFFMDREKFSELVKESREIVKNEKDRPCSCPETNCEWHGKCFECVLIHRVNQDHLPKCLQPMLRKKLKEIDNIAEMLTEPKPRIPSEYWDYANEVCPKDSEK